MNSALQTILDSLHRHEQEGAALAYRVPALWRPVDAVASEATAAAPARQVNPYTFYREHVEAILRHPEVPLPGPAGKAGDWVRRASIYNIFVRLATAYDHDGDGRLGNPEAAPRDRDQLTRNAHGIRETGTFLKSLALLGHVRRLGCDTIHLLPVTAVGQFGNKGGLGSPYAIRNPYRLEPTLADPLLAEVDVDVQFRAFVEACHHLGIRVVVEFVFRTSSRDGDWVREHPDWFYWIRREIDDRPAGVSPEDPRYYGPPPFDADTLAQIKKQVAAEDFENLPAPPAWFRGIFTAPPRPEDTCEEPDGRVCGTSPEGIRVHVPSAFADWPPDDHQPPWTDVTYLRVFQDPPEGPDFNYVAYNTVRMYDDRLARPDNARKPLWDAIRGIIPHYQQVYGIDGVMVDMGHALPHNLMHHIIADARLHHADFALLSENFVVSEESVRTGYNSVLGYQFRASESAAQMRNLITRCCIEGLPVAVFGTAETHNTPRAAMRGRGAAFCRTVWLVNSFLPDTIPFLHAGFELAEEAPVNLGLAFTPEETAALSAYPLGLFDATALHWDEAGALPGQIAAVSTLRHEHEAIARARGPQSFAWVEAGDEEVLAFVRRDPTNPAHPLLVVAHWDARGERPFELQLPPEAGSASGFVDLLTGRVFAVEGPERRLRGTLKACEGLLLAPQG